MTGKDKEIVNQLKASAPLPNVEEKMTLEKDMPDPNNTENCIEIEGKLIEIKPTKIKYFRNNSVSFYRIIDSIPLTSIYMMTEETNGIDGDTSMLLFISAVLDNPKLAKQIYQVMDAGQVLRLVEIFKRINGITEREEKSKNALATKAKALD